MRLRLVWYCFTLFVFGSLQGGVPEPMDSLYPRGIGRFYVGISAYDIFQYRSPNFSQTYHGWLSLLLGYHYRLSRRFDLLVDATLIGEIPFGENYEDDQGYVVAMKTPFNCSLQTPLWTDRLRAGAGLQASYTGIRKDSLTIDAAPLVVVVDEYQDHRWLAGPTLSLEFAFTPDLGVYIRYFADVYDLRSRRFAYSHTFNFGVILWAPY